MKKFCLTFLSSVCLFHIFAQSLEFDNKVNNIIQCEPFKLFFKGNEAILAEQLQGVVVRDWKNVLFYDSRIGISTPIQESIKSVWLDGQFFVLVDSLNKSLTQKFSKYELLANELLLLTADENQSISYGLFDLKSGKLILPFSPSEIRKIDYQNLVMQQMLSVGLLLSSKGKSSLILNYQLDTIASLPFEIKKIEFQEFEANKSSCWYDSKNINLPNNLDAIMHFGTACSGFNDFYFVTDFAFQKIIFQSKNTDHRIEKLPSGALHTIEENNGKLAALVLVNGKVTKIPLVNSELQVKTFCEASLFGFQNVSVFDTLPYAFSSNRLEIRNTSKVESAKLHPDLFPNQIQQNVNFFRSSDFGSEQSSIFWINEQQELKVLPKIKSTDWETLTITPDDYIMNYGRSTLFINRKDHQDIFLLEVPDIDNLYTISPQLAVIQTNIEGNLKYGLYDISAKIILVKAIYDQLYMSESNKIYGANVSGIHFLYDFK
jgi:hypothetical protein